ncbi:20 kDa chaperonin, chloroplastic-like [Wolffia australiana]
MAAVQLTSSSCMIRGRSMASAAMGQYEGLRPAAFVVSTSVAPSRASFPRLSFRGLVVKSAVVVTTQYTTVKPLGDRVLVKIKSSEETTVGGILLPSTAQTKPQGGEVVAVGSGRSIGETKLKLSLQGGEQIVYSKYAGTEVELSGAPHIILKEEDVVGVLDSDDIKDLKPLNDRVLIKVAPAEEKTAGGLLLTEATKEKPSVGTVVAVGIGVLEEDGSRRELRVKAGNTVLYSKYAGTDFKGSDGSDFITLRENDIMAILS